MPSYEYSGASRSKPNVCVPPVMVLPLYSSVPKSAIADLGRTTYQLFGKAVVLTQTGWTGQRTGKISGTVLHGEPIVTIKAVHSGPSTSKASSEDASGLQPVTCLACGARVMLTSNRQKLAL